MVACNETLPSCGWRAEKDALVERGMFLSEQKAKAMVWPPPSHCRLLVWRDQQTKKGAVHL